MDKTTVLTGNYGSEPTSVGPPELWAAFKNVAYSERIPGGRSSGSSLRTKLAMDRKTRSLDEGTERGLLASLAESLGLNYRREFYGFDAVFYHGEVRRRRWRAPGRILVVLEHENDSSAAHEELYKLSWIAAPLTVLITYPAAPVDESQLLQSFSRLLQELVVEKMGQLMLILGLPGRYAAWADWKAYVYSHEVAAFEELGGLTR
jgi:hypothetical protein